MMSTLAASLPLATVAHGQHRTAPLPPESEQRTAMDAINVERRELGLPLSTTPPAPRDCSVEKTCPNGTKASCSASGKFTDCGGIYNGEGGLIGVGCFAFKSSNPGDGKVSVNQAGCG
jgi:hypothetical protein